MPITWFSRVCFVLACVLLIPLVMHLCQIVQAFCQDIWRFGP